MGWHLVLKVQAAASTARIQQIQQEPQLLQIHPVPSASRSLSSLVPVSLQPRWFGCRQDMQERETTALGSCPGWQPLQHGGMVLFSFPGLRLVIIESCSARPCSLLGLQAPLTHPSCQPKAWEECGSAKQTAPEFLLDFTAPSRRAGLGRGTRCGTLCVTQQSKPSHVSE